MKSVVSSITVESNEAVVHVGISNRLQSFVCPVPTRLSLDENWRAKESGKEKTGETALNLPSLPFPWTLARRHQSLTFRARLFAKPCEKRSA